MKFFGFGSEKKIVSKKSPLDVIEKDELTGALFYLMFNGKSLKLSVNSRGEEFTCKIADIDEEKELVYLTVLGRAKLSKSDEVLVKYDISQILFSFKATVTKNDTDSDLCIGYPDIIEHFERRKLQRAVFRKNENIEIKIVTDLFSGYGILGRFINLGLGGFCCSVQKIVEVTTGKQLLLSPLLIKPGTTFSIIQFSLPTGGSFELSGVAAHATMLSGGLCSGASLNPLSGSQETVLEKFISSRSYEPTPPDYLAFHQKYLEEKIIAKNGVQKKIEEPVSILDTSENKDYAKIIIKEPKEAFDLLEPSTAQTPAKEEAPAVKAPTSDDVVAAPTLDVEKKAVPSRKEAILLVLYNPDEIKLVRRVLSINGFNNEILVSNCEEAIKYMTEQSFELIILDYNLAGKVRPEQFIMVVKNHPKLKDIPIAVISYNVNTAEQVKLVNLKVSRVCFRPIKEKIISDTLLKLLGE